MLAATDARHVAGILFDGGHDGLLAAQTLVRHLADGGEHAFVVLGHDLDEFRHHLFPLREHLQGALALGVLGVTFDHLLYFLDLLFVLEFFEPGHLFVAARREIAGLVEDVGDAPGHARGKIAPGRAEDDDAAPGHVFATVITDGFDDGVDAAVTHAEAFAGHASNVSLAGRSAVEGDVAGDDVRLGHEGGASGRIKDDFPAGQTFAEIIVGVALQNPGQAPGHEGAETLAGRAFEMDADGVFGQALHAVAAGDFAAEDGADDAVDVFDNDFGLDLLALFQRRPAEFEQGGVVERLVEAVVLRDLAIASHR